MNVKCGQMDNLLPDPAEKKSSPIKEATFGRGFSSTRRKHNIEGFNILKHFMIYLRKQMIDLEMNDETEKLKYYSKYSEYMIKNKDKIENFAKREA